MVTKFRVQTANGKALLFTCTTHATAKLMAAGCAVPTRIVAVRVSEGY